MLRRLASILPILCLAVLSDGGATASDKRAVPHHGAEAEFGPEAVIRPLEVRTRKLHLVRPDLLRFPMQYDTHC